MRRRDRVDLTNETVAAAVRGLAASVRSGVPPRAALEAWHAIAPAELEPALAAAARRLALGTPATDALAVAEWLAPVARCFDLHSAVGGSLPAMLEGVAETVERSGDAARRSRAATAGARLSARLVAGLPLAFVPLTSGGRVLHSGRGGLVLLVVGAALAAAGLWWIGKLVPPDTTDDGAATVAEDVAVATSGGIPLASALAAVAARPPVDVAEELMHAGRRVRLGESWVDALTRYGGPLSALAQVAARSVDWGIPVAGPLREWARARRAEVASEHRRALQRAPVLMVVPLTVCVLPSFALLAFGPFLLGALQST